MDDNEIRQKLDEGAQHVLRYEWDAALACFAAVLQAAPELQAALQGKREVEAKQALDRRIAECVGNARAALQSGGYEQAVTALNQAQTLGADNRILKYHAEVDDLRKQAEQRQKWQGKVAQALAQAKQLADAKAVGQALEALNHLLNDLATAGLDDLGQPAREQRDRLFMIGKIEDQIEQISKVFDEGEFGEAFRLAEALYARAAGNLDVEYWYNTTRRIWGRIEQELAHAKAALQKSDLDAAVAILGKLRDNKQLTSEGRALWLGAYIDQGRAKIDAGRQAMQRRAFADASQGLEIAARAFSDALAVYPAHPSAGLAQQEAEALRQAALKAAQAAQEMQGHRWEAAQEALKAAREQCLNASAAQKRDFSDVMAVLEGMLGEINKLQEYRVVARGLLHEGEMHLKAHAPDRAADCFRAGLGRVGEYDPELNKQLLDGLLIAQKEQDEVNLLLERAKTTADDAKRIQLLQVVYARWPLAPGMPDALTHALLAAAERALAAGQSEQAAGWCERVLALPEATPEAQEQAQRIIDAIGCRQKVTGALREAQQIQDRLAIAELPASGEYQQLVDILERARAHAGQCPEYLGTIETKLQPARARLEQLIRAERQITLAAAAQAGGAWRDAARDLEAAVQAIGDLPATELRQRLSKWQAIADAVDAALNTAEQAYAQAGQAYQAGQAGDLNAIAWAELKTALEQAQAALDARPADVQPLPPRWDELAKQVHDLESRRVGLYKVYEQIRAGRLTDACDLLRSAAQSAPNDPCILNTLQRLEHETNESRTSEAQRLLAEARGWVDRGEWTKALEQLSRVSRLNLNLLEVEQERVRLERQAKVWGEGIMPQFLDGMAKLNSNSPQDALEAFGAILSLAAKPDSDLPTGVRTKLALLTGLLDRLNDGSVQAQATEIRAALVEAASSNRLIQDYLLTAVGHWLDLAERKARKGFISSKMLLKQYKIAYSAADEALKLTPDDPDTRTIAVQAKLALLGQLSGSATKRIGRAKELRDKGVFAEALSEIDKIQTDFIEQAGKDFPELLENNEELSKVLDEASNLQLELKEFHERAGKLQPILEDVRKAYGDGRPEEALRRIGAARLVDPAQQVKLVWRELQNLQDSLEREHQEALRRQVRLAIEKAKIEWSLNSTATGAADILARLNTVQSAVAELGSEGQTLRQEFIELMSQMQIGSQDLAGREAALKTADEAPTDEARLAALTRAAAVTRGAEKEKLQIQIDELQRRATERHDMNLAWDETKAAFELRDYELAVRKLMEATRLGKPDAECQAYRRAIRAGRELAKAESYITSNPVEARALLQRVLDLTEDCPPAADLRQDAERELRRITDAEDERTKKQQAAEDERMRLQQLAENERARVERERAEYQGKLAVLFAEAQSAFALGQLDAARTKALEVINLRADHAEAKALRDKIDLAAQAGDLLTRAKQLRDDSHYDEALALVKQILTVNPALVDAQVLQAQLQAERDAGVELSLARSLMEDRQFAQAYARLAAARDKNPNVPGLTDLQGEIRSGEKAQWGRVTKNAQDAIRDRDYRKALQQYETLAQSIGSADYLTQLVQLRQTTVDQWAERLAEEINRALPDPQTSLDVLLAGVDRIRDVLGCVPSPAPRRVDTLNGIVRTVEATRWRRRLDEGRRALGQEALVQGALDQAEAIGVEVERILADKDEIDALQIEVVNFNRAVKRRKTEIVRERAGAILSQVRQRLAAARQAADLDAIRQLADELLALPGYADNVEATQLRAEVEEATRRYQKTRTGLASITARLRNRSYTAAREALEELNDVSPLLQDEVLRLTELAGELEKAESLEVDDPQMALEAYQAAIQTAPDLRVSLSAAVGRCQNALIEQALSEAEDALNLALPDYQGALERLERIQQPGWSISSDRRRRIQALLGQAQAAAQIANAVRVLSDGGDPDDALRLLSQAQTNSAEAATDPHVVGWTAVARLGQALRPATIESSVLTAARAWARQIPNSLHEQAIVKRLTTDLDRREKWAATLQQAGETVTAALGGESPDYTRAVAAVRDLPAQANAVLPGSTQSLVETIRKRIQDAIESYRRTDGHAETKPLFSLLEALPTSDGEKGIDATQVELERLRLLDQVLNEANQAISQAVASDDLRRVEITLKRADKLALPEEKARVQDTRDKLNSRIVEIQQAEQAEKQRQVEAAQEAARQHAAAEIKRVEAQRQADIAVSQARAKWAKHDDLSDVVDAGLTAQRIAPEYAEVRKFLKELRDDFERQILVAQKARHLAKALRLCDLALRTDPGELFTDLRRKILTDQQTAADRAYEQARAALVIYDLTGVENALADGRLAIEGDSRWGPLDERLQQAHELKPGLERGMYTGWQHLQRRAFGEAQTAFAALAAQGSDLEEPRRWQIYAGNMKDGIDLAIGEQHESAIRCLTAAEESLRQRPGERLSALWGSRLAVERRRAIFDAVRLRTVLNEIVADLQRVSDLTNLGNNMSAARLMEDLIKRQNAFEGLAKTVSEPPEDFDISTGVGTKTPIITKPEATRSPQPSPVDTVTRSAPPETGLQARIAPAQTVAGSTPAAQDDPSPVVEAPESLATEPATKEHLGNTRFEDGEPPAVSAEPPETAPPTATDIAPVPEPEKPLVVEPPVVKNEPEIPLEDLGGFSWDTWLNNDTPNPTAGEESKS